LKHERRGRKSAPFFFGKINATFATGKLSGRCVERQSKMNSGKPQMTGQASFIKSKLNQR
jgi:hypothetical protein